MIQLIAAYLFAVLVIANGVPLQGDNGAVPRLIDQRIVGGQTVDIAVHNHQISLRYKDLFTPENSFRHRCGGSIIAKNIVLTAAHCIIGTVASQFQVVAGTNFRQGSDGFILPVKEIIMHHNYNPLNFNYDFAILVLKEDLPVNNFTVGLVELNDVEPIVGQTATVTGWGTTSFQGPASNELQEVRVPIVSKEDCAADYVDEKITNSMLCAGLRGMGGKDACQGDSGGPLLINRKLAGVVSWGYGCAFPEYPGVYGKVNYVLPWIKQQMELHQSH